MALIFRSAGCSTNGETLKESQASHFPCTVSRSTIKGWQHRQEGVAVILQDQYWYDILPSSGSGMNPIDGKWLYFDDTKKVHALLDDLNALVESADIPAAKIARKIPAIDPFPEKPC